MTWVMGTTMHPSPPHSVAVGVAHCYLDDDRNIALAQGWAWLAPDEMLRARRFHFDRDRDRYVRGRGFLRLVLGQVCTMSPADLVFGTGAQGKPFLPDHTLAFNLSHSCDLAVLAVSQAGPVGIDVEFIDRKADIAGLAQTCLTDSEQAVLDVLPDTARAARFFAFWTAKEARMKLTGEGMSLPPREIVLDLQDGLPIGYLRPDHPATQATFLDIGVPAALCCLAMEQGPAPLVTPPQKGAFA